MRTFDEYRERYAGLSMERDGDGVLTVRLPDPFTGRDHREIPEAWSDIAGDLENRVVVLTGRGENFFGDIDFDGFADLTTPEGWDTIYREGRALLRNLANVPMPVVAAVNGPAKAHGDIALLADIVVASEDATFRDNPHVSVDLPPGDGAQVVWPWAIGPKRASYFLWMDQTLDARTALEWGVVNEVLPKGDVLPRAYDIAGQLGKLPTLTLRYTRDMMMQRIKRLLDEGTGYGLALEGLTSMRRSSNVG